MFMNWTDVVRSNQKDIHKVIKEEEYQKAALAAGLRLIPSQEPIKEIATRPQINYRPIRHKKVNKRSRSIEPKAFTVRI